MGAVLNQSQGDDSGGDEGMPPLADLTERQELQRLLQAHELLELQDPPALFAQQLPLPPAADPAPADHAFDYAAEIAARYADLQAELQADQRADKREDKHADKHADLNADDHVDRFADPDAVEPTTVLQAELEAPQAADPPLRDLAQRTSPEPLASPAVTPKPSIAEAPPKHGAAAEPQAAHAAGPVAAMAPAPAPNQVRADAAEAAADATDATDATDADDAAESPESPALAHGFIDFFGYSIAAAGWFFCGWVRRPQRAGRADQAVAAVYDLSRLDGRATIAFYKRDDIDRRGIGLVAFLPASSRVAGDLQQIAMALDGMVYHAMKAPASRILRDRELTDGLRALLLQHGYANPGRDKLLSITLRAGYAGKDTLASLSKTVLVGIDEAILCPPRGVLLMGWQLSAPGSVRAWRVRCGHLSGEFSIARSIPIQRPDVLSSVEAGAGFSDPRCGFIAYVAEAISAGDAPYLEVELENGEVGFKPLKLSNRAGMSAIRHALDGVDLRYARLAPAFDHVLGPAVGALNAARLADATAPLELAFGEPPPEPKYSLVIPLHGRIDVVECQIALLSRHRPTRGFDIVYVLDDPGRERDMELRAQLIFERFRIPFRVLLLDAHRGVAPASNAGLNRARGEFVCFLNSAVFPITRNWIEQLASRIDDDPDIGVIGPRLLFEDDSVQHEGCVFRPKAEFGNWNFVEHLHKGRRPKPGAGLRRCDAISGACMVMRRSLAEEIGGFDEGFVLSGFEDADLCGKLRSRNLECVVDRDVELYHLERKSPDAAEPSWRMNVTLYNAWRHQRRWFAAGARPGTPPRLGTTDGTRRAVA